MVSYLTPITVAAIDSNCIFWCPVFAIRSLPEIQATIIDGWGLADFMEGQQKPTAKTTKSP